MSNKTGLLKVLAKFLPIKTLPSFEDPFHCPLNDSKPFYLLEGPRECELSSLIFEAAFQAAENNLNVAIFRAEQYQQLPHFIENRSKPSSEILERIHIHYLEDTCGLVNQLCHLIDIDVIFVDGIEKYIDCAANQNQRVAIVAKIVSVLLEATFNILSWSRVKQTSSSVSFLPVVITNLQEPSTSSTATSNLLKTHWGFQIMKIKQTSEKDFEIHYTNKECDTNITYRVDNGKIM